VPPSEAAAKLQLASGIHCACSKRCWIENSQTPTIEAITVIGSWTAATTWRDHGWDDLPGSGESNSSIFSTTGMPIAISR